MRPLPSYQPGLEVSSNSFCLCPTSCSSDGISRLEAFCYGRRTVLLHDLQELDDDLGARADEHLALAGLLGVVHRLQGIVENGGLDHLGGVVWVDEILKARALRLEVSVDRGITWSAFRSHMERKECPSGARKQ